MGDPDDEPTMGSYYAIDDPPPDIYDLLHQLPRPQETSRTKNKREQVERFKHRIWTCRDGTTIPLSNMSDQHLTNAYRMLRRKGFVSERTFWFYMRDKGPNGDMAQDAFQQEIEQVLDSQVSPWLDVLEVEIKRRSIDV